MSEIKQIDINTKLPRYELEISNMNKFKGFYPDLEPKKYFYDLEEISRYLSITPSTMKNISTNRSKKFNEFLQIHHIDKNKQRLKRITKNLPPEPKQEEEIQEPIFTYTQELKQEPQEQIFTYTREPNNKELEEAYNKVNSLEKSLKDMTYKCDKLAEVCHDNIDAINKLSNECEEYKQKYNELLEEKETDEDKEIHKEYEELNEEYEELQDYFKAYINKIVGIEDFLNISLSPLFKNKNLSLLTSRGEIKCSYCKKIIPKEDLYLRNNIKEYKFCGCCYRKSNPKK